jgi:hypothetical protein
VARGEDERDETSSSFAVEIFERASNGAIMFGLTVS